MTTYAPADASSLTAPTPGPAVSVALRDHGDLVSAMIFGPPHLERSLAIELLNRERSVEPVDPDGAAEPAEWRWDEPLQFGAKRVPRWLVDTIVRASRATGVDPVYMMALADKESSFLPEVRARTSTAEGLFQFIEKTWLEVVRDFGPQHGLAVEAAAIETVGGRPMIADPAKRERILDLRRNPYLAAVMAAELLKRDRERIEREIGRDMRPSELYIAHFLGVDSAGRFLELLSGKPTESARRIFPRAARANQPLFFAREGRKRKELTIAEVYERIGSMIDARLDRYEDVTAVAAAEFFTDTYGF